MAAHKRGATRAAAGAAAAAAAAAAPEEITGTAAMADDTEITVRSIKTNSEFIRAMFNINVTPDERRAITLLVRVKWVSEPAEHESDVWTMEGSKVVVKNCMRVLGEFSLPFQHEAQRVNLYREYLDVVAGKKTAADIHLDDYFALSPADVQEAKRLTEQKDETGELVDVYGEPQFKAAFGAKYHTETDRGMWRDTTTDFRALQCAQRARVEEMHATIALAIFNAMDPKRCPAKAAALVEARKLHRGEDAQRAAAFISWDKTSMRSLYYGGSVDYKNGIEEVKASSLRSTVSFRIRIWKKEYKKRDADGKQVTTGGKWEPNRRVSFRMRDAGKTSTTLIPYKPGDEMPIERGDILQVKVFPWVQEMDSTRRNEVVFETVGPVVIWLRPEGDSLPDVEPDDVIGSGFDAPSAAAAADTGTFGYPVVTGADEGWPDAAPFST